MRYHPIAGGALGGPHPPRADVAGGEVTRVEHLPLAAFHLGPEAGALGVHPHHLGDIGAPAGGLPVDGPGCGAPLHRSLGHQAHKDIRAGRAVTPVGRNAAAADFTLGIEIKLKGFYVDRSF